MIKSRKMRWAGQIARMGEEECIYIYIYIYITNGKAGKKGTTRRSKTWVGGYY
jgi:hypothetical protein